MQSARLLKPMYLTVDKDALAEHDALPQAESVTEAMNSDNADTWWMDESFMDDSIDDFFLDEDGEPDEQSEVLVEDDTTDEVDDREPQMLLSTIVYNAMREAEAKNRYPNEKTDIVFHSSREIKSILNSNIKSASNTLASRDLMICRYSGLLESCSNSLLLYVPNAMGMDWGERIVRKELATHTAFAKLFSKLALSGMTSSMEQYSCRMKKCWETFSLISNTGAVRTRSLGGHSINSTSFHWTRGDG